MLEKCDLILLDEDLHYMSGDEVVKKLHSIRNFDIPVVLLTKDSNVSMIIVIRKMDLMIIC